MYDYVFFDLDGTLTRSGEGIKKSAAHAIAQLGYPALTEAQLDSFVGPPLLESFMRCCGMDEQTALEAVRLIFENLDRAVERGSDMDARRNMLRAAFLAGSAFSKSYVGYVHAVAHSLGGKYNIPHGLANAVLLPGILESYGETVHPKLARLAEAAGVARGTEAESARAFIAAIRGKLARYGIAGRLPEIRAEDVPALARKAAHEANPLYPVPVLMDARELENFYYMVMEDRAHGTVHTGGAA